MFKFLSLKIKINHNPNPIPKNVEAIRNPTPIVNRLFPFKYNLNSEGRELRFGNWRDKVVDFLNGWIRDWIREKFFASEFGFVQHLCLKHTNKLPGGGLFLLQSREKTLEKIRQKKNPKEFKCIQCGKIYKRENAFLKHEQSCSQTGSEDPQFDKHISTNNILTILFRQIKFRQSYIST